MERELSQCSKLTSLNLRNIAIGSEDEDWIIDSLKKMRLLERLEFDGADVDLGFFVKLLTNLKSLGNLAHIHSPPLSRIKFLNVCSELEKKSNLRQLR